MLKALILSTAILGLWYAAALADTPSPQAPTSGFVATDSAAPQPGMRGPVIQI